ncbi:MAG TPA: hypothetical protein VNX65_03525 [Patescibacteria group bacterium]|jgi:hypothetical protein|nr:hypothetical protein [Patescibacteria group bacterium]
MAGPVSHIVYAEKALQDFLPEKDKRQFAIGNIFPDIRYLGVIDRELTHFKDVTLKDIHKEADSFRAGMLFHSIIDETREAFVLKHDSYSGLPDSHLSTIALKVCEDIRLYHEVQDWHVYIDYLKTIEPEERAFNIPTERIEEWHAMHRAFFADFPPNEDNKFFFALGFNKQQVSEIFDLVKIIIQSNIVDNYLYNFYDNLEQLLAEQ